VLAVGAEAQPAGQEIEKDLVALTALGLWLSGDLGRTEGVTAAGEKPGAAAVGEEAVVADPDEALGENVEQEAAGELLEREGEGSSPPAPVVLEAEGDSRVVDVDQAVVRDRDAVGVTGEILQDVLGAVEGWLGVDDPFGAPRLVEEAAERGGAPVVGEAAVQLDAPFPERFGKLCEELAPEEAAEHAYGKEEPWATRPPGVSVIGQAACGDHAVHMGMVHEGLAPGVKDGEEPEAGTEMAGVGGDLLKRPGCGAQQQVVDDLLVLERERRQALWDCEHHVGVRHRQHLRLACCEPERLGTALALRAVAVATRVVGDRPLPAGVARIDVTTQPCRPARQDGLDDRALLPAPGGCGHPGLPGIEVAPEDLRDLVSRSLGHLPDRHEFHAQRIQGTPRRSHTLCRHVRVDRRRP